ncbi:MAG: hypothetical protein M1823_001759 [Watsoniomyces obsoletus]|nr:MAG: hypothetical protein M1823_001759 [Watsoniomyces obsoletus]
MDPLSISASVITLLVAVGKTGEGVQKLFRLADAPDELATVTNDIAEFRGILSQVRDVTRSIEESMPDSSNALESIRPTIDSARQDVQELDELVEYQLKRSDDRDKKGRLKVARGTWLRKKDQLEQLRQRLRTRMVAFTAALSTLHIHLSQENHSTMFLHVREIRLAYDDQLSTIRDQITNLPMLLESRLAMVMSGQPPKCLHDSSTVTETDRDPIGNQEMAVSMLSPTPIAPHPTARPTALCMGASVRTMKCPRFCRCRCHVPTQFSTPRWMKNIFGSFFGSFRGYPLLHSRTCDYSRCRQSATSSTEVLYVFPAWFVKRAIVFNATWKDLSGPGASWTFRMPRLISKTSPIWGWIQCDKLSFVRAEFRCHRASPYDVDEDGLTPLHYAVSHGRLDICNFLVESGADLYVPNKHGLLPVQYVLQQHWVESGTSAAASSWQSIVPDMDDALEEAHLTVLHRMILGVTRGNLAEHLDCDDSLIDAADLQGWTPLHLAAYLNDIEAVRILLGRKANPDIQDREGLTPLHTALRYGCVECANALLERGASAMACDVDGFSALHHAALSPGSATLVHVLIQGGVNPNAVSNDKRTPLHIAAQRDNVEVAKCLLDHGADVDACDKNGPTPLWTGIFSASDRMVEMLLQEGAQLDHVSVDGSNILHYAALYADQDTLKILLNADFEGVDPPECESYGATPLEVFDRYRFWDLMPTGFSYAEDRKLFLALLARAGYSPEEDIDEIDYSEDDENSDNDEDSEGDEDPEEGEGSADDEGPEDGEDSEDDEDGNDQHASTSRHVIEEIGFDTDSEEDIFQDAEDVTPSEQPVTG